MMQPKYDLTLEDIKRKEVPESVRTLSYLGMVIGATIGYSISMAILPIPDELRWLMFGGFVVLLLILYLFRKEIIGYSWKKMGELLGEKK